MRTSRRAIQRVAVLLSLLVLGAIVNVAVAWGAVLLFSRESFSQKLHGEMIREAQLASVADDQRPFAPAPAGGFHGIFRDVLLWQSYEREGVESLRIETQTHRCGFPFRTLQGSWKQTENFGELQPGAHNVALIPINVTVETQAAIPVGQQLQLCQGRDHYIMGTTDKLLPLQPLWPGSAINTIFYAAMLWVVWFTPRMVRRRIRRRRGLCPACAYPRGISPVCTECGKSLA